MVKKRFTISELAAKSGVSERTLRFYEERNLLLSIDRNEKGARMYGLHEAMRLQQILLYKKMQFSLDQIQEILDNPSFDLEASLKRQVVFFKQQQAEIDQLLFTITNTLKNMQDKERNVTLDELYDGFRADDVEEIRAEAEAKWGESFQNSEKRMLQKSKAEIEAMKQDGDQILTQLSLMMHLYPEDSLVQNSIKHYHEHLNLWAETPKERWSILADVYVEDQRFKATYEKYAKGFAAWISKAIKVYCSN